MRTSIRHQNGAGVNQVPNEEGGGGAGVPGIKLMRGGSVEASKNEKVGGWVELAVGGKDEMRGGE